MAEKNLIPRILLASTSPRRRELMTQLGLEFEVVSPDVEEVLREGESAADFARRAARDKAHWTATHPTAHGVTIIAADTVVTIDGEVLGKPVDEKDARRMLRMLSGRTHEVMTGICLLRQPAEGDLQEETRVVATQVTMKSLSDEEINAYIATGEPADKAGAYAIQGRAGYMVSELRGSYTNVVGLPLTEVAELLEESFGHRLF